MIALLSACASMFKGIDQSMNFRSDPEGASVIIDGLERGVTPVTLKLQKDEFKNVTFKKQGYHSHTIPLTSRFDKIGLINIANFGIGFTTDASTGAMFAYVPGTFYVSLAKKGDKSAAGGQLERNTRNELNQYVLTHYSRLKQQCKPACDNEHMKTLVWLVAAEYKQASADARRHAEAALRDSIDPIDYLQKLKQDLNKT